MSKSATISLNVDADLVAQAQERGINLDELLQRALLRAVAEGREPEERERIRRSIDAHNRFVDEHGLFADEWRTF